MGEMILLSELKPHPDNPRTISQDGLEELKRSIQDLEKMFELEPIKYDENKIIWSGNQRYLALLELGYEEIPKSWTKEMVGFSDAEKKAYMIKANIHSGKWNESKLQDEYWELYATEYGDEFIKGLFDDTSEGEEITGQREIEPEIKFSEEVDVLSNYLVLKFHTKIDWINAVSLLGIETGLYARRQNGKAWNRGLGRVIDGASAIKKIQESK